MADGTWNAVELTGTAGAAPLVLVCEHASRAIPPELADLGLDAAAREAHVAWDIGAAVIARRLSEHLEAPLVAGGVSRLVYDCNRPFTASDCIPARSERYDIPGNRDLDEAARRARFERVHEPFHAALAEACRRQERACGRAIDLVTIHTFTPVYNGVSRAVEIGYLHHEDPALAQAALAVETAHGVYRAALDEPYSARDGVTYTLARHGEAHGRRALMIEVRNDLVATHEAATRMGDHLAQTLREALAAVPPPAEAAP
ncbi:N-formylglutamate amidohydrolase [Salinarimonas ramus]|uniref:N-formylglutamate amidohydrolase n=1 Tax=Salinarimonas ramus TaxID=690164 RepID=A0A917QC88_9HYPH|nr:N-formylglutamate amidohydrolase [Salinarimonas ramus]GGK42422.1 N-formylglutamate amidohydrolase [Salinarimonas ramus]